MPARDADSPVTVEGVAEGIQRASEYRMNWASHDQILRSWFGQRVSGVTALLARAFHRIERRLSARHIERDRRQRDDRSKTCCGCL